MTIHAVITHGREGAINGEITMTDGHRYAFCDIYRFNSAKGNQIKAMTSYIIDVSAEAKRSDP